MALTPVGVELFLAGIEYSTRPKYILVQGENAEVMIVEDAFIGPEGKVMYNAAVRGSGAPGAMITVATPEEVVAFVKSKLLREVKTEESADTAIELEKLQDLVRRHVENYGSDVDPRLKAYYNEKLS